MGLRKMDSKQWLPYLHKTYITLSVKFTNLKKGLLLFKFILDIIST